MQLSPEASLVMILLADVSVRFSYRTSAIARFLVVGLQITNALLINSHIDVFQEVMDKAVKSPRSRV
jgi:hypothetical protein